MDNLCECGCGTIINKYDKRGREREIKVMEVNDLRNEIYGWK